MDRGDQEADVKIAPIQPRSSSFNLQSAIRNTPFSIFHPPSSILYPPSSLLYLLLILLLCWFLFFYGLADRDLWSSHEVRAAQDAQTILTDQQWGLPRLFDGTLELQTLAHY